jgi:NAD(P)-dependent dehydrogenase (short-subunit alcohol dehydrogenase family)
LEIRISLYQDGSLAAPHPLAYSRTCSSRAEGLAQGRAAKCPGPTGGIDEVDPADWERTIDINLNGQYYFARRAVPLLKASQSNPSLIAIASVAGRLGYAFRTPYAATKWSIVGLVKSLAIELGPSGIRANAILPGIVEGERMNRVIAARAETLGVDFETMRKEYLGKISLRRMVTVDDVAAMALFLCSPAARNITGQVMMVLNAGQK